MAIQQFEQRPNSGALFINSQKKSENQPDLRGDIYVDRDLIIAQLKKTPDGLVKLALSAWNKTSAAGNNFQSLAISEPYEKPTESATKNPWE
jgi:hypothetical protein